MNSVTTSAINVTDLPKQSAVEEFIECIAMNHVEAMEGLFAAIEALSKEYSTLNKLAKHGRYLALSLHNDLDCQRGDMEEARTQTTAEPAGAAPLPPNVTPMH